jgi:hypothetical protein
MAVKLMMFDGTFNDDGASASSSPSWLVEVIDCIVGESEVAFVREVRLRDEHDVYVSYGKKFSQFFCVLK